MRYTMQQLRPKAARSSSHIKLSWFATAVLFLVGTIAALGSTRWVGKSFPGFLVMENQVVASIGLPTWLDAGTERLFQSAIVAVDGVPIRAAEQIYAIAAGKAPGTQITYVARNSSGERLEIQVPARWFGWSDYALLFGAYLLNGVVFLIIGVLVHSRGPAEPARQALLALSVLTAFFILTAVDLYSPYLMFRLHGVAEAMLAAGFLHLALVFPRQRLRSGSNALYWIYGLFLGFAAVYQLCLPSPEAYKLVHLLATATHGITGFAVIGAILIQLFDSGDPQARSRLQLAFAGALAGLALPAVVMAASALTEGRVALNAGALTAFLFPVGMAAALRV